MSGQLHTPAASTPEREPQKTIEHEAGCTPERVWAFRRGEQSLASAVNGPQVIEAVAWSLYQLGYLNSNHKRIN
jgi:hypothetical protein